MSRLKREMDRTFEQGRADAWRGLRPNPGMSEYEGKYMRWAYDAGHKSGTRECQEWFANPDNGIPTKDVS